MMLSEAAIKMLETIGRQVIQQKGEDLVVLVVWVSKNIKENDSDYRLGIGFIERHKVPDDRIIAHGSDGFPIYQYLPDFVLDRYLNKKIDVIEGTLVFI